ncbi:glycosyltransferase [Hymenobacter rigui]|uniref:Glycosyltransferase n=1 Tax=Hymenobacter rigui TaxID=334424 RepID=A0A428K9J6_9BACT|nr:glycosyltransferase [Hymenobacter rigui]RSK43115.1 glycosyltransferase [Hymenobacter rigui]
MSELLLGLADVLRAGAGIGHLLVQGTLYLLAGYLLANVAYLLFFALAGHLPAAAAPTPPPSSAAPPRSVCVLLPAYQADAVVLHTAPAALAHRYAGPHTVCVVADGLQPATVAALRAQSVLVVEVQFERSTKGQALQAALAALPVTCDVAVVLDVDNVMAPGFLTHVNEALAADYRVVQGQRTAKNLDSPFAVLDACNEAINNHIFRLGHARLGMSASLIGSGMAFEYAYLHQLLENIGQTAGEDKELDFRILQQGVRIGYLPQARVLDEKVASARVFGTQRTRWMAAQLEFLGKYAPETLRQLRLGRLEFVEKVLQSALLPRVLLLGLLSLLLASSAVLPPGWGPPPQLWAGLLAGTALALLIALPRRWYRWPVLRALLHLPLALLTMIRAATRLRQARQGFLPTPHSATAPPPQV